MTCTELPLLNQAMNLFLLFPLTALFQLTASWQLMELDLKQAVGRNQLLCSHSYQTYVHLFFICLHCVCICIVIVCTRMYHFGPVSQLKDVQYIS